MSGGIAAAQLRSFVERYERLDEEKKEIADQMKAVMAEAKGAGFEPKIIKNVIKLRKLTEAERAEFEALMDLYKGALGMLDGTPLGAAAVKRLEDLHKPKPKPDAATKAQSPLAPVEAPEPEPTEKPYWHNFDSAQARALGAEHCRAGKAVTDNPFPARDPRRAAYDEGWCQEAGSDGMDIPAAWRRSSKKDKKSKDDAPPVAAPQADNVTPFAGPKKDAEAPAEADPANEDA